MNTIIRVATPHPGGFALPPCWAALNQWDWERTRPDAHWLLVGPDGAALARASAWWRRVPALEGERAGLIGHFAAVDGASGARMLDHAATQLAQAGASLAIGPIDGSTWESYRCVVESDGTPAFPLEPAHPAPWLDAFAQAGFGPWAGYHSAICDDLAQELRRGETHARSVGARSRVRLRAIEPGRWQQELRLLHRLSAHAFRASRLNSAITEAAFVERFDALSSLVVPELTWLAEIDREAVGFVFALHGAGPVWGDTVVVKTLCTLPRWRASAIGFLLVRRALESARSLDLRRAVFALMDDTNLSARMIARRTGSRVFRRYALFARRSDL